MKAKCIIDYEHYYLENGKVYNVEEYKKDKTCFRIIDKINNEYHIYSKSLFEYIEQPKLVKQKKEKFDKKIFR